MDRYLVGIPERKTSRAEKVATFEEMVIKNVPKLKRTIILYGDSGRSILGLATGDLTWAGVSGPLKPGERGEDPAQALLMRYKLNYAEIEKRILCGQHRVLGMSLVMRFSERGLLSMSEAASCLVPGTTKKC